MTASTGPAAEGAASDTDVPVAIVGIGCRYADARGPEEMWDIIRSGRNTVREAPQHRIELGYDVDHFYDPRPRIPGRISSKKGGFLEHPELFDPAAFGIAPRDALTMDPQQRLMVEVTWDALEDAGIVPSSIEGERVAVILGFMAEDYSRERAGVLGEEAVFRGHDVFTVGGMSHAVMSGRIAFLLGVTGPSFTLDTACSSSLIATHLACQSLRRGEADMALAGGANLFLSPEGNIALSRSGMLSASGACRAFDAGADGFVRAEGAGVVVLKRLPEAIADGDPIYAVIRGSGISTDGRDGGHMMAPGRKGQAQAMRDAYAQAGVAPSEVQYVETHGTGTMIGDPVEIGALADVMGPARDPAKPLRVASVKGHLGHTESASGVAGLIQACLAIRHRTLPAQMHFESPNPAIPWSEVPIRVQTELEAWPEPGPALVGVNSFGISGTNAHVVLESPPEPSARPTGPPANRAVVLPVSAHDPRALDDMLRALRIRLARASREDTRDVLHTLGTRRSHREHRVALVADSVEALPSNLEAHIAGDDTLPVASGSVEADRRPSVVMVFPGQGSQWLGMGRSLLADEPVFADAIDRLDVAYAHHVDWSLRSLLETSEAAPGDAPQHDWTRRLDQLQPVLVAFEIALAALWKSWGIVPDRVVGQSMGEIAAAHVAGALDLATTAHLACHRGRVVRRAAGSGGMAVVALARSEVDERLASRGARAEGRIEIAGVNAPTTTIVAGDREALATWIGAIDSEGVFARMLEVDFASHCFHMDPLIDAFRDGLRGLEPRAAAIPLHSTVDGEEKSGTDLDADYWVSNLRSAVAFDRAMDAALDAGGEIFLEVSPHSTLARPIAECASSSGRLARFVGSLTRDEPSARSLARSVAELFAAGAPVDFAAYGPGGRVTTLPLYAYQRERYWFSERTRLDARRPRHPLLGDPVDSSLETGTRFWTFLLDADSAGFATDHRVGGGAVLPSTVLVELALAAARSIRPSAAATVHDLETDATLVLADDDRRLVQVVARPPTGDDLRIAVSSRSAADGRDAVPASWTRHGTAVVTTREGDDGLAAFDAFEPASLEAIGRERFDDAMTRCGVEFGPRVTCVRDLYSASDHAVVARLMLPRAVETEWHAYHAHPALLEAALQLGGLTGSGAGPGGALEILGVETISIPAALGSEAYARVVPAPTSTDDDDTRRFDCVLYDAEGAPNGALRGVRARNRAERTRGPQQHDARLAELDWQARPSTAVATSEAVTRWILFASDVSRAEPLAAELRKRGSEGRFCGAVDDFEQAAQALAGVEGRPWGLVVLDPADDPIGSAPGELAEAASDAAVAWIVTSGRLRIEGEDVLSVPSSHEGDAQLRAFARIIGAERCRFFDRSAAPNAADDETLAELLRSAHEARCLASRSGRLLAPRLVPADTPAAWSRTTRLQPAGDRNLRVERVEGARRTFEGGSEPGIVLRARPEPAPGPTQVVVEVLFASLSRRDVVAALSPRIDDAAPFGNDFVGRIVAIGAEVDACALGGTVLGIRRGSLERRLVVEEAEVVPLRPDVTPDTLAVLPDFVAEHALHVVARTAPGERILVDAGRGPIAHALVRTAIQIGADVHVIARSKRAAEAFARLGATTERPGEAGPIVSLVVSDASHADAGAALERLAPTGRYVDLRPPTGASALDADPIHVGPNQSVTRIDSLGLAESQPEVARDILERVAANAADEGLRVSAPTRFPIAEIDRAIRYVAQDRHGAGVVTAFEDVDRAPVTEPVASEGLGDHIERVAIRGDDGAEIDALSALIRDGGVARIDVPSDGHPASESAAAGGLVITLLGACAGDQTMSPEWETDLWLDLLTHPPSSDERRLLIPGGRFAETSEAHTRLVEAAATRPGTMLVALDAPLPDSPLTTALQSETRTTPDLQALSAPERRDHVLDLVRAELGTVLGLDAEQSAALTASRRLDAIGLDSLMSVELFVGLGRTLSLEVARDWFASVPTLGEIASVLADRVGDPAGDDR